MLLVGANEKVTKLRGSVDDHQVKVEKELEELRELLKNQKVGVIE